MKEVLLAVLFLVGGCSTSKSTLDTSSFTFPGDKPVAAAMKSDMTTSEDIVTIRLNDKPTFVFKFTIGNMKDRLEQTTDFEGTPITASCYLDSNSRLNTWTYVGHVCALWIDGTEVLKREF